MSTLRAPSRFSFVSSFLWAVRIAALVILLWGVLGSIILSLDAGDPDSTRLTADAWRGLIVTGIAQGSLYGLIALGYSLVYGVLGFINFAHGEVFMAGAMVGFFAADALAEAGVWESQAVLAIAIVMLVSIGTSTLVAVLVERVAYRPLRDAPRLIPLITSIGMSFFIQYSVRGLFGDAFKRYPAPQESLSGSVDIVGFQIKKIEIVVIVVAALAMVVLYQYVTRSKAGRAMRAVAEDKEIAGLMGIDVDRTIVTTFAVGGAMAGIAGTLWSLLFRQVFFLTGFLPGIKAFTAAVLGGIGNMVGAYVGGLALGLFEAMGPQVVLGGLEWELHLLLLLSVSFAVLAGLALLRPSFRATRTAAVALGTVGVALALTLALPSLRDVAWSVDIPGLSQLKDVVAFTALVLVLIFRPTGLLGERLAVEERA